MSIYSVTDVASEISFSTQKVVGEKNTHHETIRPIKILDAKNCGLEWKAIQQAISDIADRELKDDRGIISASDYVQEAYFKNLPIEPGLGSPEFILVAMTETNNIVGFIINRKSKRSDARTYILSNPIDTSYVAYLAVDSTIKRSGIGTQLMLASMRKTQEMGKRYLTLEYISEGLGVDKHKGEVKKNFYNSFATRFKIPIEEDSLEVDRQLHVYPYYDLKEIELSTF